MPVQDTHVAHVSSAGLRYGEIRSLAAFVCGKTWLCIKQGNLAEVLSTPSLQVESIFPAAQNEENVKRTSLCFFCSYVEMDVFRLQYEEMGDYPAHLFPRQLVHLPTR